MSTDYHDKGEQDARDDNYEKPHGILDDLTTWSKSGVERNEQENQQYDDGYHHGKGQQDAAQGEYNRPHGIFDDLTTWSKSGREKNERENNSYDSGHNSTSDQKSGGCYLTTACIEAAGLPDTCSELTVLRRFRDTYMARQPIGAAMIAEYYDTAPHIVAGIKQSPMRVVVLDGVLSDVRRAVALIEGGDDAAAFALYRGMFRRLQAQFAGQ